MYKLLYRSHFSNRLNTSHIRETVSKAVEELDTEHTEVQKRTLLDLFGTLELAKVTTVTCLVGFVGGTCYFGIHHYATLLGLDIFIIVPLMGLLQVSIIVLFEMAHMYIYC